MTDEEATAAISAVLGSVQLQRIDFLRVAAERVEGSSPVGEGLQFPMTIQAQMGRTTTTDLLFRVSVDVERPDVLATAEVVVVYAVDESPLWDDQAVMRVFGGRIAVPAAIPFVRAKMREVTSDMGTLPIMLGMYEPRPLTPVINEEGDTPLAVGIGSDPDAVPQASVGSG